MGKGQTAKGKAQRPLARHKERSAGVVSTVAHRSPIWRRQVHDVVTSLTPRPNPTLAPGLYPACHYRVVKVVACAVGQEPSPPREDQPASPIGPDVFRLLPT